MSGLNELLRAIETSPVARLVAPHMREAIGVAGGDVFLASRLLAEKLANDPGLHDARSAIPDFDRRYADWLQGFIAGVVQMQRGYYGFQHFDE